MNPHEKDKTAEAWAARAYAMATVVAFGNPKPEAVKETFEILLDKAPKDVAMQGSIMAIAMITKQQQGEL